jgi:cyclase
MTRGRPRFTSRAIFVMVPIVALAVLNMVGGAWAAAGQAGEQPVVNGVDKIEVLPVQNGVYLLVGAGGNIVAQIGPVGVILVDTGVVQMSDAVVEAIGELTSLPIRYIINTNGDTDHVGGNERLSAAGRSIMYGAAGGNFSPSVLTNNGAASILAHDNVLGRMSRAVEPFPFAALPTKTFTGTDYTMYLNGEGFRLMHQPAAHSDGDLIVLLRRADVIVAGDIFDTTRFPVIDVENGGSIQGEVDALNRIIDLTIAPSPLGWQEDRTYVIPGHGRISDQIDVVEYRDTIVIIRDRVQDLIDKGMTLEQVQAANPADGYRRRYGSDAGAWTTEMFIEAVYRTLSDAGTSRASDVSSS